MLQGTACDGRKIGTLTISLRVKYENTVAGPQRYNRPALVVHFYDSIRRPVSEAMVGPWFGTGDWRQVTRKLTVPSETREIVIRAGLNGATGRLCVDNLKLTAQSR